jgi:hypothetical protein
LRPRGAAIDGEFDPLDLVPFPSDGIPTDGERAWFKRLPFARLPNEAIERETSKHCPLLPIRGFLLNIRGKELVCLSLEVIQGWLFLQVDIR